MFYPTSYAMALLMMFIGMFLWGSWLNTLKLTRNWRFELFYFDYALGIFLTSVLVGLTLGTWYGVDTYWVNLHAANRTAWLYAFLAGIVWNAGNILLTAGVSIVGMAVAFPATIGLALVVGVTGGYVVTPRGNPVFLFVGVAVVFLAVIASSLAYRSAASSRHKVSKVGMPVCLFSGILFSVVGPLLAKASSGSPSLGTYGLISLFTLGGLLSTFPLMAYLMKHPLDEAPLTVSDYWKGSLGQHVAGLAGGVLWTMGTTCVLVPQSMVRTALAYSIGHSNALVAVLWGVLVWREFRGAPAQSLVLAGLTFVLYFVGLVFQAANF